MINITRSDKIDVVLTDLVWHYKNVTKHKQKGSNQMVQDKFSNRLADAFPSEDCFTIEQVAKELGVKPQRTRQLLRDALKRRLIQNISKKDGVRVLYPEPMVEALKKLYENNTIVKYKKPTEGHTAGIKNARMVIHVPIFDSNGKDVLMQKFGSEAAIVEFLKSKLIEVYKPTLSELEMLDREYEERKKKLLSGHSR